MNRRPFGVNYEFVSAGYTRGRVRWPWIAIKCKSSSSKDPMGDVSRRQISRTIHPRLFRASARQRNFRTMLFNISRSMVGNIGGKLDSIGFIERHVANNSIGERLKNYWQRLLMLMIHDRIMVYNYFCINFVRGFMYNGLNLIDASIQTSLR